MWDYFDSVLVPNTKIESSYNANDDLTEGIMYGWHQTDSVLAPLYRYEYTYHADRNLTSEIDYNWYETDSIWAPENKTILTFDNTYTFNDLFLPYYYSYGGNNSYFRHKITLSISSEYINADWVLSDKTKLYYSPLGPTGIYENITTNGLKVFPNPATDFVTFELENISQSATLELYNIQGKKVLAHSVENSPISVSNLSPGLYLYKVIDGESVKTGKLIIK
jgi:hypothetical protein